MTIPLDNQLTPVQNAQRYFKKYQKARTTREIAAEQKEKTLKELDYLEGTLLDVGKCIGESELEEIRQDLMRTGYIRKGVNRRHRRHCRNRSRTTTVRRTVSTSTSAKMPRRTTA